MIGASRESLASVQESLRSRAGQGDLSALSAELLAVADLLASEKSLRVTLSDGGQSPQARTALISDVLKGKVSDQTIAVLGDVVSARWSSDKDLIDAVEILGAQAGFASADSKSTLDRVEEEIFEFGRAVAKAPELQMALTDPSLNSAAKSKIVADIFGSKVAAESLELMKYVAGHLRGRRVDSVVELVGSIAAAQRNQSVAEVRSAIALSDDQRNRLGAALAKLTGRDVRLNVAIDPEVIGGISVRIGDEVIDGTVASRLEQARRALLA